MDGIGTNDDIARIDRQESRLSSRVRGSKPQCGRTYSVLTTASAPSVKGQYFSTKLVFGNVCTQTTCNVQILTLKAMKTICLTGHFTNTVITARISIMVTIKEMHLRGQKYIVDF